LPKYKRSIVLAISDTHGGHKLGLLNPETTLERKTEKGKIQKYTPELHESQKFLWESLQKFIKETKKLAEKDHIAIIHDGDLAQGNVFPREQISTRISDQVLIAAYNMYYLIDQLKPVSLSMAKGTGSHEFGEGSSVLLVEEILRNKYPHLKINSTYHAKDNFWGSIIDYAHHGASPGKRWWLKGNECRYYLRDIMEKEIHLNKVPANVYLRGHYHTYVKEILEIEDYTSMMINLPGFCMLGDYGTQITKSEFILQIGVVALEIINGQIYNTHKFMEVLDLRSEKEIL